jgi:putative tricarboxylic transport membrane protein
MNLSYRILGAVCVLLGLAYIWGATQIETGLILDPLGPQAFPIIVGCVLVISAIVVFLQPDPAPEWPRLSRALEIVAAVAVLIAYALTLEPVGFVVSTAIAASILSWRLGSEPLWAIISGIGISVGIYTVFHLILGLSLARGPLGF